MVDAVIKNNRYDFSAPEISIVTPAYNRAGTIKRTMQSLVEQTNQNFEWILVDDGSSDNLDDIVSDIMDIVTFPMIYLKKKNGGVHTARNAAIKIARGDNIILLDSDDELVPNAIEVFLERWAAIPTEKKHLYREIVAQCIDQKGNRVGQPFPASINEHDWEKAIVLCDETEGEHCSMMVASILKENPWPEPEGITFVTEDIIWKKLEKQYRSYFINDMLRIYHLDTEESYSNVKTRSIQYCKNVQWNYGYRLDHWNIYKSAKESKLKALAVYSVFTEILRKNGITTAYSLTSWFDNAVIWCLKLPAKFVAQRYLKNKMN